MFFQIDTHNGLAVYDQIVRQVKFAVADGAIRAGELIPSVREVARELAVTAAARRQCQIERTKLIRARLRGVLEEAVQSGLEQTEIEQLVRAESLAARKTKQKG